MNFLTGLLVLAILYSSVAGFSTAKITGFFDGCPLQSEQGLQVDDELYKIDGRRVFIYSDVGTLLARNKTGKFDLVVKRDGQLVELNDFEMPPQLYTVDGVEQSRRVISETVTKEPVTQVVVVGTKKKVASAGNTVVVGDGVATGRFGWPVPVCRNTSRGFRGGHGALDICNGPVSVRNKPFIAADGGVVVEAAKGWNGGYGNMIRIRHSNGYETIYAHCSSLYVVTGQKVTKGQQLGLIGSTGRTSGCLLYTSRCV